MNLFTEKYIFLLAFVLIHFCLHPKKSEILKRWTQMPHFVAFQLFSDIKKTFSFLFCSEIRFFSFSEQCRNLIFYVQRVLVLKIIFLVWNSVYSCLIVLRKKENIIKTMIIAFPLSFQTILWPLQIVSDFISFWYPVFSYLKQQQSKNNLLGPCKTSLMHLEWVFLRKNTFFS